MSALIPPHRQYTVPHVSLAEIEWQLDRAEVRKLVGNARLLATADRFGITPDEALNYLATAPRWLLPLLP
ncbi:hypothetical protein ACH4RG_23100 [Streptomyces sp. NPDC021019]|uniref:hypothetical protein n=1 Tax=Streptomyces sp. NPDC021019 TaxID=3365108 RepID=UPI003796DB69